MAATGRDQGENHGGTTTPDSQPGVLGEMAVAVIRGDRTAIELAQQIGILLRCCRFRERGGKIVTKAPEWGYDRTDVQP